jgi:FkbM family methyltransferase
MNALNTQTRKVLAAGVAGVSRNWPFLLGRHRLASWVEDLLPMSDDVMSATLKDSDVRFEFRRSDKLGILLYAFGEFESHVFRALKLAVEHSGISIPNVVDLGANIGLMSLRLAAETGCRTISVEPQPGVRTFLERNARANGLQEKIRIVAEAVGEQSGELDFYVNHRHPAGSSMRACEGCERVQVQVRTLGELVTEKEWRNTAVMKVDIEGFEPEAFRGALDLFAIARPPIVFEINSQALHERGILPGKVSEPLRQAGYTHFHALDEVLYNPQNGATSIVDILATTDEHEPLRSAYGCMPEYRPPERRHFPLAPVVL